EPEFMPWTALGVPNRSYGAYLFKPITQRLRKIGVNVALINSSESKMGSVLNSWESANMRLVYKGSGLSNGRVAKNSDPNHPHRKPGVYSSMQAAVKRSVLYAKQYGQHNWSGYLAGDERHLAK